MTLVGVGGAGDPSETRREFQLQQLFSDERKLEEVHTERIDDPSDHISTRLAMEIIDTTRMCAAGTASIAQIVDILFLCDIPNAMFSLNEKKLIYDFVKTLLMSLDYPVVDYHVLEDLHYIPELLQAYESEFDD